MAGLTAAFHSETPIPLALEVTCAPGELTALVGPSGSGKSTILRAIAGLYRPQSARVVVDDEIWADTQSGRWLATWQRRVGLVAQSYALFPHLTAQENVAAALTIEPPATRGAKAATLLARVNLTGLEHRRPAELSGGQQQRVAVARALAREPKALLLDEPFSAVDKVTRTRLYRELAALRQNLGMPIILVTHDLDEALMLADRVCLVQRGRIIQSGPSFDVVDKPATVEAARLVGQRNIYPARVRQHDGAAGPIILDWRGMAITATEGTAFAPGADVTWLIPPSRVVLSPLSEAAPTRANMVTGRISELVNLGEAIHVTLDLDGPETRGLAVTLSRRSASPVALTRGARVAARLHPDAIHVMPAPAPRKPRRRTG